MIRITKLHDSSAPLAYSYTKRCLVVAGGTCAVALDGDRRLWRVSVADPAGSVQDLSKWSAPYRELVASGAFLYAEKLGGGALFAYKEGFGVVFSEQILLFDTASQAEPFVYEILNSSGAPQNLSARFVSEVGRPQLACWMPGQPAPIAVAYDHQQFVGRAVFVGYLEPYSATAYRLTREPQRLTLAPAVAAHVPASLGGIDEPVVVALRPQGGGLQVATAGGYYSSQLLGRPAKLPLFRVKPGTTELVSLDQQLPILGSAPQFSSDNQYVSWNRYSPVAQGGLYFYNLLNTETTRLGFRQKVFTTGLFHEKGEMLKRLSFYRLGPYLWLFSGQGHSLFEVQDLD
ncbi:hypothetical protein [Hymenobacter sp. DG01]|uniref:hypothetical protein n=1 Tax=Hymenobacter sp. DG01 TaxID=2584940 RepID=UPI0015DDAE82|nr:hypothetical protein [Hymenobacter sp. DG01]